ncbi:hypothetical protein MRX96_025627 [Rhipicephalus microplus]
MCTFPDDVKGAGERPYREGQPSLPRKCGPRRTTASGPRTKADVAFKSLCPKELTKTCFLMEKEFPPIGNLANFGNQQKIGIENGETVQGGMPSGIDEQWRWNLRKQEHQGFLA